MSWFEIIEVPTFILDEFMGINGEYIDKSYSRVSKLLNNTWICIYPGPGKLVFENGSEFKQDFSPLIKDSYIKPVSMKIENPQTNSLMEHLNQVILNVLVTKDLATKVFDYNYLLGETLAYIAWSIRAFYHLTIQVAPFQYILTETWYSASCTL